MRSGIRYVATTLALVAVAVTYVALQRPLDRPAPKLQVGRAPAVHLAPVPPAPLTARDALDRAFALDLRPDQMARLQALDRLWRAEAHELERAVQAAQQEFAAFMKESDGSRGATVQEIERRSADFRGLSGALREGRQRHAEAALGLLADWQRSRLFQMRPPALSGGHDEGRTN